MQRIEALVKAEEAQPERRLLFRVNLLFAGDRRSVHAIFAVSRISG
jgi:hypothetical protein